ncbi:MAG: hypothetical protein N4A57_15960 [Anaeromicrobium sp.]|jgi:hypothetical protein|uniref:hypothetical protein n=1 Tax=Anaeromicrobium sp. TaxID=1929132 RepID=UPI0025FA51D1|nr:hypothetical protein [Anaeromicrobium sp.]MCT4595743.1 hypothetical protein [Anaeromicrobium sp.]
MRTFNIVVPIALLLCIISSIYSYRKYKKRINNAYIVCTNNLNIYLILSVCYGIGAILGCLLFFIKLNDAYPYMKELGYVHNIFEMFNYIYIQEIAKESWNSRDLMEALTINDYASLGIGSSMIGLICGMGSFGMYFKGKHMEVIEKGKVVSQVGEWTWDSLLEYEWGQLFMKNHKAYYELWLTFKNDERRRKSTSKSRERVYLRIGKDDKSKVDGLIEINS